MTLLVQFAVTRIASHARPAARATADEQADQEAIRRLVGLWSSAVNAGDAVGYAVLFTDDAVVMRYDGPKIVGKAAVRAWVQRAFDQFTYQETNFPIEEIKIFAQSAYARGAYTQRMSLKNGAASIELRGKYVAILEREPDSSWKLSRTIWNSDIPAPSR